MGRLVIEARGTAAEGPVVQGVAAVGNSAPLKFIVSVTDADGVPVNGLAAADFSIHAILVGAGGSLIEIASAGGGQHGDYRLDFVPVTYQGTQYIWAFGRYIFVLAVTHGVNQGQTVCSVFVH